jgi:hypothetical protein
VLVRDRARTLALSAVACATLLGCPVVLGVDGTFELRDGGAGAEGSTGPYCASLTPAPRFCDDFDSIPLAAKWSDVKVFDGGGVALDTAFARSSPRSLRSWIDGNRMGSDCTYATVATSLVGPARATHLGYAVRFGDESAVSGRDASHISSQSLGTGGDLCSVLVNVSASALVVEEQVQTAQPPSSRNQPHTATRSVTARQWARLEVDVDYVAKRLVLTLDGQIVVDDAVALDCPHQGRPASALVGLYCAPNVPAAISVRYDDVVFDAR